MGSKKIKEVRCKIGHAIRRQQFQGKWVFWNFFHFDLKAFFTGGVAVYNFGVSNVTSWERLGNDYSNDVISRVQHLVRNYGWG